MKKAVSRRRAAVGPGILAFAVVIVLSLLTVSCGHGKSAGNPANSQLTTRNSQLSLDSILAEIDAYQPPKGVDAARFETLRAELRRQVIAQRGGRRTVVAEGKAISSAPTGSWDAVTDLGVTTNTQGTQATLTWTEKLWGDFDNSGEVGIGDIVPLAQYYFDSTDDPDQDGRRLVTGDSAPVIDIGDMIAIAYNYGCGVVGYRVYRGQYINGFTIWDTTWRPNPNTNNPDWSADRPYPPPASTRPSYTYVDNISGLLNKTNVRYKVLPCDGSAEGTESNAAIAPPPGTFEVSGVVSAWGAGLAGVTLTLTPRGLTATSQSDGAYKIYGAANGQYVLTPTKTGIVFTPSVLTINVANADVTSANFSGTSHLATSIWPRFRGNAQNTGLSPYDGPQTNAYKWEYALGPYALSSPVIGPDGTIYIGGWDAYLYAIRASDGHLDWISDRLLSSVHSPAAVRADGAVFVAADPCIVMHFQPDGTSQGRLFGGAMNSCPAISPEGDIYVGSESTFYLLNGADGDIVWRSVTGGDIDSSAALGADGTVYVGCKDGKVYAIDPTDGSFKWTYQTGDKITSSAAVGPDGTVYVGSFDTKVYALNPSDGSLKWATPTAFWVVASPAIGPDGRIYIGSGGGAWSDNYFYCMNPSDGSVAWTHSMPDAVESSAAIGADGKIYVGCDDGNLYALNASNGSVIWTFATQGPIPSSPAIGDDGVIYVCSDDGHLYAIGS